MEVDVSRIIPHMLRLNDIALLSFPEGVIPIRVVEREFFNYLYDPVREGQIGLVSESWSDDGVKGVSFKTPEFLKSGIIAAQPINVLRVTQPSLLYQVFFGVAPSYVRLFIAIPSTAAQRSLDIIKWSEAYAAAGYIDGFVSPLLYPSPDSELILPYGIDPAIGYANIIREIIHPLIMFYVNKLRIGVVTDVDLVMEMLEKRDRGRDAPIKIVGGMTRFDYPYREVFKVAPIPIGATKEEVARRLR